MPTKQKHKLLKAIIKSDKKSFFIKGINTLLGVGELKYNFHIDLIIKSLDLIEQKKIKRLIISMPPRYLKSICVSVCWTSWLLAQKPSRKIIVASNSMRLSIKHLIETKKVMLSKWYTNTFGNLISKTNNTKEKFFTMKNGFRMATSIGSSLIGDGGDILIVDDPHKTESIFNYKSRDKEIRWFSESFLSRLNNKRDGIVVIVMQRIHKDDLIGSIQKNNMEGWHYLCLPMYSESPNTIDIADEKFIIPPGFLHEAIEGREEMQRIKKEIGEYAFQSQYQQSPLDAVNGLIKQKWISYYQTLPELNDLVQSWDTSCGDGENNDYSACTTWKRINDKFYLVDVIRKKMTYPELKSKLIDYFNKYKPIVVLIENKSSGQQLIQELSKKINIVSMGVHRGKMERFTSIISVFERRKVFFPDSKTSDMLDLEHEVLSFPNSKHDDCIDSISQYFCWHYNNNCFKINYL